MPVDKKLLAIRVVYQVSLADRTDQDADELICHADQLAFPVKDEIPIMLETEARQLESS